MNEGGSLALAFTAGVLLGAIFFGGLWWTVQKVISSTRAAGWFVGSLLIRTGIVLAGFYFVAHEHWENLFVSLFGFFVARVLVTRLSGVAEKRSMMKQEAGHAPQSR